MVLRVSGNNNGSDRGGRDNQDDNNRAVRVLVNHNADHDNIRRLIQGALDPLIVDPVPYRVLIDNIVVTREPDGQLAIHCEVAFEVVVVRED